MLSSRALQMSASMLRAQPAAGMVRSRAVQTFNQTRGLRLQATPKLKAPVPKEEHSAHTISQRLRTLKKIPPELIPLGIVVAVAVGFAGWSLISKLWVDGTLRLSRTRAAAQKQSEH